MTLEKVQFYFTEMLGNKLKKKIKIKIRSGSNFFIKLYRMDLFQKGFT